MILSDREIRKQMRRRTDCNIFGVDDLHIGPGSIDLHIADTVKRSGDTDNVVKVWDKDTYPNYETSKNLRIEPNEFVLATTMEYLELPDYLCAFIWGRSSVGRLGIKVHNAGFTDPGYEGELTLELKNEESYPIQLEPGMRICQITIHRYESPPSRGYGEMGKYQNQRDATESKLHKDFE